MSTLAERAREVRRRLFAAQRKAGVGYIELDDDLCDEVINLITDLEDEVGDGVALKRTNSALKGQITKLKKRLESDEGNAGSGRATQ